MKRMAVVFEEPTGFYYCSDDLGYLDARGRGFPTKKAAMTAAYEAGFTHARGSGTYKSGATILSQVPTASEWEVEHNRVNSYYV